MKPLATLALATLLCVNPAAQPTMAQAPSTNIATTSASTRPNAILQQLVDFPSYFAGYSLSVWGAPGTRYELMVHFRPGSSFSDFTLVKGVIPSGGYIGLGMYLPHDHASHAGSLTYEVAEVWSLSTAPVGAAVSIHD